jgi:hypothetical protein
MARPKTSLPPSLQTAFQLLGSSVKTDEEWDQVLFASLGCNGQKLSGPAKLLVFLVYLVEDLIGVKREILLGFARRIQREDGLRGWTGPIAALYGQSIPDLRWVKGKLFELDRTGDTWKIWQLLITEHREVLDAAIQELPGLRAILNAAATQHPECDPKGFIPAKRCRNDRIKTHRQLTALLRKVPDSDQGIRRKPKGNHLLVYSPDWEQWNEMQDGQEEMARRKIEKVDADEDPRARALELQKPEIRKQVLAKSLAKSRLKK